MLVVALIALIAALIIVALNNARVKARDTKRKADIAQLVKGLDLYYANNQAYPATGWVLSTDTTNWPALLQPYVQTMPKDPINNGDPRTGNLGYAYFGDNANTLGCGNGQAYILVYDLEILDVSSPGMTGCNGTSTQYTGPAPKSITLGSRSK